MKDFKKISEYHEMMESNKWMEEIPYIKFPKGWEIKAIPPITGAVIRYRIKKGDAEVSVYLDCYDQLGYVGKPYWEVYMVDDDCYRCLMNETDKLLYAIKKGLEQGGM